MAEQMRTRLGSRTLRRCWWPVCALLAMLCGCSDYHWRSDYQQAEQRAREQQRYLFIFYKYWLDSDSGRMLSGEGLSDPAVARLLKDTVNLLIDQDFGPDYRNYVAKYGVNSYPAIVMVAPDGSYQVRMGYLPKDRLVEFIEAAKSPHPPRPGLSTPKPQAP